MNILLFVIVYGFLLMVGSCSLINLLPETKVDCTVDIDGAPRSETYPECYCKETENLNRIECKK